MHAARLAPLLLLAACGEDRARGLPGAGESGGGEARGSWLVDVTATSGVEFVHASGASGDWILPEVMGGGGALFDADGDGRLDLLLLQGGVDPGSPTTAQAGAGHRLFLGDGALGFRDVTAGSGLEELRGYAMTAAVGDVDDDGRLDLFITHHGVDRLLLNRGGARFEDVTEAWGAGVEGWSTAAAFADLDQDGDLDLFVARYLELDPDLVCRDGSGRRTYCPPRSGAPVTDVMLLNAGGRFEDVSRDAGLTTRAGAGLGVVIQDFTGDGRPDVFVANDGYENHLWSRAPDGSWRDEGLARGVALNQNGLAEASMGVVAEDLDGDLGPDLFMTHLVDETHTLYRGRAGSFVDETGRAGLFASTKPGTGFGVAAVDLELDGDLDLVVAQGRVTLGVAQPGCAMPAPWDALAEADLLLVNDGSGRFDSRPGLAPALTGPVTIDRAVVSGDLDGDGDRDLVVTRIEGPALVLRNDSPARGRAVTLDPRARADGPTALGALLRVSWRAADGAPRARLRAARASDGYLTSRDPRVDVALPGDVERLDVEVVWPDGVRERFDGVAVAPEVVLLRGAGEGAR